MSSDKTYWEVLTSSCFMINNVNSCLKTRLKLLQVDILIYLSYFFFKFSISV